MAESENGREFDNIPVITPEVVERMGASSGMGELLASGRTIEQIRSKYHTAIRVQVPRDLDSVKKRCLQEAKHGGDEFGWAWPVEIPIKDEKGQIQKDAQGKWLTKKEIIDGPGVHLMMAAARNWGNCTTELYVTTDLPDRYELMGVFVDFETGYTNMRPYTIRKASRDLSDRQKKSASQVARQEDMTMQIGLSKCIRNVIKGALPSWLIDSMYDESKKYSKEALEKKLPAAIESAIFTFGKYGVTVDQIEVLLECPKAAWTADHIIKLRGLLQGIKDGDMTISEAFPQMAKQPATEARTAAPEAKAEPTSPPAATATELELNAVAGDKLKEITERFYLLAGNDPARRKEVLKNWGCETLTTIMHIGTHPELIENALAQARKDCEEAGEVWPPKDEKQGKIL